MEAIEEARAHGDLSENAEYHAAKERQGQIEAMIADLEDRLSRAMVIDPTTLSGDKVVFGATVTLIDEDEKKVKYQLVGQVEADANQGRISYNSPLGRALIGRQVGEEVEVDVTAFAHGGHAIARHEGQVLFVRHTLPGERVRAVVTSSGAGERFVRADAVDDRTAYIAKRRDLKQIGQHIEAGQVDDLHDLPAADDSNANRRHT